MDFQGKVIQFIGETTGTSKAGNPWKKKEWLVETFGPYPKKVRLQCFGDRSDSINLQPGKNYTVYVDLESREFNGRWYTDVNVYRADECNPPQETQPGQNQFVNQPQMPYGNQQFQTQGTSFGGNQDFTAPADDSDEDLPF